MRGHLIVLALLGAAALTGCGDDAGQASDTSQTSQASGASTTAASTTGASTTVAGSPEEPASTGAAPETGDSAGTGVIAVRLEPVDGFFIEGFEVGLRFETPGGDVIAAALWSEFVQSQDDPRLEAYYESVLEQPVPAGDVVVLATANVGIGPGPEVPDLDGEMRCRLDMSVPEGATVEVEVSFADQDCLRQV
jgi:hypothetical protein